VLSSKEVGEPPPVLATSVFFAVKAAIRASIYDADPLLKAPPADLSPSAGSPVIGKGVALREVPASAGGSCWSGPPNIGAH
jgi:xanthine dehydrogenase molybdopterin-binding subunit B